MMLWSYWEVLASGRAQRNVLVLLQKVLELKDLQGGSHQKDLISLWDGDLTQHPSEVCLVTLWVTEHWNGFPGEFWVSPSWIISKNHLVMVLGGLAPGDDPDDLHGSLPTSTIQHLCKFLGSVATFKADVQFYNLLSLITC